MGCLATMGSRKLRNLKQSCVRDLEAYSWVYRIIKFYSTLLDVFILNILLDLTTTYGQISLQYDLSLEDPVPSLESPGFSHDQGKFTWNNIIFKYEMLCRYLSNRRKIHVPG